MGVGPDLLGFVDTNVVVYAFDPASPKHARASALLQDLGDTGRLRLSVQVLREFYSIAIRKLGFTPGEAREVLVALGADGTVGEDVAMLQSAADLHARHALSFWDALIVAAAIRSGARTLYSEDLGHERTIEGVRVVNPFAADG